jgi:hypothetical protein
MPTSSFTYTAAIGQRVANAYKATWADEYTAALAANPDLTDKAFFEAVERRRIKEVVRQHESQLASNSARATAEAQVSAAVDAAINDIETNVVIT